MHHHVFVIFALLLIFLLQASNISNALIGGMEVDQFVESYREHYPQYLEYAQDLKNTVFSVVEKMSFVIPPISTFRVKKPDSLMDKLNDRKKNGQMIWDLYF